MNVLLFYIPFTLTIAWIRRRLFGFREYRGTVAKGDNHHLDQAEDVRHVLKRSRDE